MKRSSYALLACLPLAACSGGGGGGGSAGSSDVEPVFTPHPGAFSDQTAAAGIDAEFGVMHPFVAGGAVGDFDRDGWPDFFYPAGGNGPDKLYLNQRDGTFEDRAADWGVAVMHRSSAAAVGDFNGDDWVDIYVSTHEPTDGPRGPHLLYLNNRNGTFTDVAVAAGVDRSADNQDGWGGAWGDYDLDGDLDLVVAALLDPTGNILYRNNGDMTFSEVLDPGLATFATIYGFAPRFLDMDDDGWPDLVFIGDRSSSCYYKNNGDGTFTDLTAASGTSLDLTEMGATIADFDEDGDFDIYVTTIDSNNLYINQGHNVYVNQAAEAGVEETGVGWGAISIDFNHDSHIDLLATSNFLTEEFVFRNESRLEEPLRFEEVSNAIGLEYRTDGRGLVNFDYDNDGDQDVLFFPATGKVTLYRNDVPASDDTRWIDIILERDGVTDIAPHGVGSIVEIDLGARTLRRHIDGGTNYMSQSELSAHFGVGNAEFIDEIRVLWTNGMMTRLTDVRSNQFLEITP